MCKLALPLFFASLLCSAQTNLGAPLQLDPNSPEVHTRIKTTPIYPPIATGKHVSGAVILHIVIQPDGSVSPTGVVSGPPELVKAAQDAVTQWKYAPVMRDGHAVTVATTATVNFK